MGDEKQFYISLKKGSKEQVLKEEDKDREEYLITMQHAVTAQNEKTQY